LVKKTISIYFLSFESKIYQSLREERIQISHPNLGTKHI